MNWKRVAMLLAGITLVVAAITLRVAMHGRLDDTVIEIKGQRLNVEVAQTDFQRSRGLMLRKSVPEGTGMLFVFENDQPRAFWMKNTKVALDILYFDANRQLVGLWKNVPPCTRDPCPNYPSRVPMRYTLEVQAGGASALGLREGDTFTLLEPLPAP